MYKKLLDMDDDRFFPAVEQQAEKELRRLQKPPLDMETEPPQASRVSFHQFKIRESARKRDREGVLKYVDALKARQDTNRIAQQNRRLKVKLGVPTEKRGRPSFDALAKRAAEAARAVKAVSVDVLPDQKAHVAEVDRSQLFRKATTAVEAINVLRGDPNNLKLALTPEDLDILTRHNMTGEVLAQIQESNNLFDVLFGELKLGYGSAFQLRRAVESLARGW